MYRNVKFVAYACAILAANVRQQQQRQPEEHLCDGTVGGTTGNYTDGPYHPWDNYGNMPTHRHYTHDADCDRRYMRAPVSHIIQ